MQSEVTGALAALGIRTGPGLEGLRVRIAYGMFDTRYPPPRPAPPCSTLSGSAVQCIPMCDPLHTAGNSYQWVCLDWLVDKGDHACVALGVTCPDEGWFGDRPGATRSFRQSAHCWHWACRGRIDPFAADSPLKMITVEQFPSDFFFVLRVVQLLRCAPPAHKGFNKTVS